MLSCAVVVLQSKTYSASMSAISPVGGVGQEKCAYSLSLFLSLSLSLIGCLCPRIFSPIERTEGRRKEGQTSVCASLLLPLLINMLLSKHPTSSGSF